MNIKIELPASFTVMSRGVACEVSIGDLSADIIARLALHGLHQKVADAASNAKAIADEAKAPVADVTANLMAGARDGLVAGTWTQRTSGAGVDERTRVARSVVHAAVKAKFGAKSPDWATFTGLDDAAQNEKLDAWFAANEATFAPAVDAEVQRRAEKRAAKTELAKSVTFEM